MVNNWHFEFHRCKDGLYEILLKTDLSKAFDTINFLYFIKELEHYEVTGCVNRLISNYLFNRWQFVAVCGHLSTNLLITTGSLKDLFWDHFYFLSIIMSYPM